MTLVATGTSVGSTEHGVATPAAVALTHATLSGTSQRVIQGEQAVAGILAKAMGERVPLAAQDDIDAQNAIGW